MKETSHSVPFRSFPSSQIQRVLRIRNHSALFCASPSFIELINPYPSLPSLQAITRT